MALMIRGDIKMSKGKVLAQISHAMVSATVKAYTSTNIFYKWQADGEKIVILKVPNLKTLFTIINIATRKQVPNGFVNRCWFNGDKRRNNYGRICGSRL